MAHVQMKCRSHTGQRMVTSTTRQHEAGWVFPHLSGRDLNSAIDGVRAVLLYGMKTHKASISRNKREGGWFTKKGKKYKLEQVK